MEKRSTINTPEQASVTTKQEIEIGDIVLVKDDMERNRWPMAKVVATYKDYKGVVRSVRLLMGSVDRVSQKSRYLERPVNKLVVLVENKDEVDDGLIPRREAGT